MEGILQTWYRRYTLVMIFIKGDDLIAEDQITLGQEIDLLKWWHVNKSGFPMATDTWEKMWQYIRQVHPDGKQVERMIREQQQQKVSKYYLTCMVTNYAITEGSLSCCSSDFIILRCG